MPPAPPGVVGLREWRIYLPTEADVAVTRARLAAGGAPVTPAGDGSFTTADPWGIPLYVGVDPQHRIDPSAIRRPSLTGRGGAAPTDGSSQSPSAATVGSWRTPEARGQRASHVVELCQHVGAADGASAPACLARRDHVPGNVSPRVIP